MLPELEVEARESQLRAMVVGARDGGGGEVGLVEGPFGGCTGSKLSWSTGIGYEILGLDESTE